jgi:hypothetical protein
MSSGQEYGNGGPTFVFTKLNDLKPQMIAEATASAREAAEQFARDSKSTLSGIKRGSQGYFEILPRDQAAGISEESQVLKRVRVVTTVEYGLALTTAWSRHPAGARRAARTRAPSTATHC